MSLSPPQKRLLLLLAFFGGVGAAFGCWRFLNPPPINVLLITLDTTRADRIGCYGHDAALTPTLDRLADTGVLFERAYAPAPLTLPSHATMMTGLLPPEHGLVTNGKGRLSDELPTLAETLSHAGYETGAFVGSFVLNRKFGLDRGFAHYDDDMTNAGLSEDSLHRQRDGLKVVDSALKWLGLSRTKPFFCWVHLYDPHDPYLPHPHQFGERFANQPYDGEIAYVDLLVRRMLDQLDARGLRQQTVIVVVGDHGEGLGEHDELKHGLTLYSDVIQVPWIWSGAGVSGWGHRAAQPVSIVDLRPTLLAALGVRDTVKGSGRSLAAALAGGSVPAEACYSATDQPLIEYGWHPLRSLTTDRWKYIRSREVELYDLQSDPHEKTNLAGSLKDETKALDEQLAAIERGLVPRQGIAVNLTAQEKRALASLGYLGGQDAASPRTPGKELPDVKKMLPLENQTVAAHHLLAVGDAAGAERRLRELIDSSPDFLRAQLQLIEALSVQGKYDEGLALVQKILEKDPDNGDAHFQAGIIYSKQGQFDKGVEAFRKSLVEKPDAVGVLINLGRALAAAGQPEEAERYFRDVLEQDSGHVQTLVALGNLLSAQDRFAEAERNYDEALRLSPGLMEGHANLAILLMRLKRPDDAGPHFAKAAALAPENAETRFNYGTYLLAQGMTDEAIRELEAALRLNPNHSRAAAKLQQARDAAKP